MPSSADTLHSDTEGSAPTTRTPSPVNSGLTIAALAAHNREMARREAEESERQTVESPVRAKRSAPKIS